MVEPVMLEVEAKVRAPGGFAAVRAALRRLGAEPAAPVRQEDLFFAHPARDLASTDEALRLRRVGDRLELTYKGPRHPGAGAKAREERTVPVGADPTALLEGLGFRRSLRLAKTREAWRLEHAEVALDDVDGLGQFVEVEVQADDAGSGRQKVAVLLERLGLAREPVVAEAYIELLRRSGTVGGR